MQSLVPKAGTLDATTCALIRVIDNCGYSEGKRVDEKREITRRGAKKAQPTLISRAYTKLLKRQQANTPQDWLDTFLRGA